MNQTRHKNSPRTAACRLALPALIGLVVAMPLGAEMCVLDQVPAATLLLPYFEVPLDDASRNTVITLHNATPLPTLVHVTMWADWAVPTVSFDIFFTGYDVQTFDLGDAFRNGNLPITADQQSDPDDLISPHGDPSWDGNASGCIDYFPFYHNPLLTGSFLDRVRQGHTGQPVTSVGGGCFGSPSADLARGYITFDVAARCSVDFPYDPGYFGGLDPVGSDENRVFGEVTAAWFDGPDLARAYTTPLVHVEADPSFDAASTASGITFYGAYSDEGLDHREPLPTTWAVPTQNDQIVTSLVAWRDARDSAPSPAGYTCGVGPSWIPLDHPAIECWNDQEDVISLCTAGSCLPLQTQSVGVDTLSLPWDRGWCRVDLRSQAAAPSQSWLGVVHAPAAGDGPVSAMQGITLASSCDQLPPPK